MKVKIIFFALLLLNINSFGQTNSINFNIGDVVTSKINNVEILKSPDDSSEVLYKVKKEYELIYLGEISNSFSKIKFNNKNGWIDSSFLTNKKITSISPDKNINKKILAKCQGDNYLKWTNCIGSFTYLEGTKKGNTYQGEILDGKAHGFGKRIGPDSKYEGEFKNDFYEGLGTLTTEKGEYVGMFKDGNLHGKGVIKYTNGDKYDGEFSSNKHSGTGTYWFKDGHKYTGDYLNGQKHGKGIFLSNNGDIYEGSYEKGEMTGVGKFSSHEGVVYTGGFLKGKYDGEGSIILPNGDRYIGQFKNGKYHGIGSYISADPFFTPSTGRFINNEFVD